MIVSFDPTIRRGALLAAGEDIMRRFCADNDIEAPTVVDNAKATWPFGGVCAYYRPNRGIQICVDRCAEIGTAGRSWSYPGYVVDRTPYGVIQHELGHHVDVLRSTRKGSYFGDFSVAVRGASGEEPITSYAAVNDAEWFAEAFRLFVTNPDLLRLIRPRTYRELIAAKFWPAFVAPWRDRLALAPARTVTAAARKIEAARAAGAETELPLVVEQKWTDKDPETGAVSSNHYAGPPTAHDYSGSGS